MASALQGRRMPRIPRWLKIAGTSLGAIIGSVWLALDFIGTAATVMDLFEWAPMWVRKLAAREELIYQIGPWVLIVLSVLGLLALHFWPERASEPATRAKDDSYLSDRDTEIGTAIYLMTLRSAWARWYAAQYLSPTGGISEGQLIATACHVVTDAAKNGDLEVRGRNRNEILYTPIPRESWRLIFLNAAPDPRTLWRVSIRGRRFPHEPRI